MTMRARAVRVMITLGLALAGGAGLVLAGSSRASASCMPPTDVPTAISQSDIAVVGTVTSTRSRDRIATVRVEELWKGDVGGVFEVFGGPSEDNMATSVDRVYEVGGRYLLFALEPAAHGYQAAFGGRYEDSGCSTTQAWNAELAQFRPATATIIGGPKNAASSSTTEAPPARTASDPWWQVAAIIGSGSVLTAGAVAWRRRARKRPQVSAGVRP